MSRNRFDELRRLHPTFSFEKIAWEHQGTTLTIKPTYTLSPDKTFTSVFEIQGVTEEHLAKLDPSEIDWWAFQIGMVELISYWKLTCSPTIVVKAGWLDGDQIKWWQDLLLKGLGEFFYVNQLDFTLPDLVKWEVTSPPLSPPFTILPSQTTKSPTILLPLGGGKDSLVSQDLLLDKATSPFSIADIGYLLVNPTPAALASAQIRPARETIIVTRKLDPQLLELNHAGYLNGHTPFSALVAIISCLVARLFSYDLVAVSNERSSNEGNVQYLGQEMNHQYSKSFQFESTFRDYLQKYATPLAKLGQAPYYFSLLRPIYELQIARHFSEVIARHPDLATAFRSCNRGQKTNTWCGDCSKCLFATIILAPFTLPEDLELIFGQQLLDRLDLEPIALELLGLKNTKPFECVGTYEESLMALYLTYQKYSQTGVPLPALLAKLYQEHIVTQPDMVLRSRAVLAAWNTAHAVPASLEPLVKALSYAT